LMKTYQFVAEQIIPQSQDKVFTFFADARNLQTLTPPWLHFHILTPGRIDMHAGQMVQYALRVRGLPIRWTTAICDWHPPHEFVDIQLNGPYAFWHHRHRFESLGSQTRIIDEIHYGLPLGWLGRLLNRAFVRRDIEMIFRFRERTIGRVFESSL